VVVPPIRAFPRGVGAPTRSPTCIPARKAFHSSSEIAASPRATGAITPESRSSRWNAASSPSQQSHTVARSSSGSGAAGSRARPVDRRSCHRGRGRGGGGGPPARRGGTGGGAGRPGRDTAPRWHDEPLRGEDLAAEVPRVEVDAPGRLVDLPEPPERELGADECRREGGRGELLPGARDRVREDQVVIEGEPA